MHCHTAYAYFVRAVHAHFPFITDRALPQSSRPLTAHRPDEQHIHALYHHARYHHARYHYVSAFFTQCF